MISRKASWLIFAVFGLVAVLLYQKQHEKLFANSPELEVYSEGDAIVLEIRGNIEPPLRDRFEEALTKHASATDTIIIDLDSNGGSLREGSRVIEVIQEIESTHRIITRVQGRNRCLSMCVPIFLQGEERFAGSGSRWMFHEPAFYDAFDGDRIEKPEFEQQYYANRFFEKFFDNSPMTPHWREQLRKDWVGNDVWKTGEQLVDEDSGIVTRIIR